VSDLVISERVLARWWPLVSLRRVVNHLHRAMSTVYYRSIAMAINMAIKVGTSYIFVLFAVALAAAGAIRSK
jgi:hypothetical protein